MLAKRVEYDNKSQRVRLILDESPDEEGLYGILDGGNTNERINKWREELTDEEGASKLAETFVNAQVLIPTLNGAGELSPEMQDLLNDIREANRSH